MGLHSGILREKIEIKRPERTQNDTGGWENVMVDVLNTFAAVEEVSPNADVIASQENTNSVVSFIIRYRPDINLKTGDRIFWRDFSFQLNNFKVDPLRTQIKINAISEIEETRRYEN